ncbi:MAG: hypothetical protein MZW92_69365 [Comamonadaceae bacterium]|nr:hypothetical protein [Comamonadaceae bacterium]
MLPPERGPRGARHARARRALRASDTAAASATALWATRAGNVFTTHTPGGGRPSTPSRRAAGSSTAATTRGELRHAARAAARRSAGRPGDAERAVQHGVPRGRAPAARVNGVSRAARPASAARIFAAAVPALAARPRCRSRHVTNGVHMPSWDSPRGRPAVDRVPAARRAGSAQPSGLRAGRRRSCPTSSCGTCARAWRGATSSTTRAGACSGSSAQRGAGARHAARAREVLDPERADARLRAPLHRRTSGPTHAAARPERLARLLDQRRRGRCRSSSPARRTRATSSGKALHRGSGRSSCSAPTCARARCSSRTTTWRWPRTWCRAWTCGSTRRAAPWEACGTSGMKVLVNGGLNLSELDGWWAEAYTPEVGWAHRRRREHRRAGRDDGARPSSCIALLEQRGGAGVLRAATPSGMPRAWVARHAREHDAADAALLAATACCCEYVRELLPAGRRRLRAAPRRRRRAGAGRCGSGSGRSAIAGTRCTPGKLEAGAGDGGWTLLAAGRISATCRPMPSPRSCTPRRPRTSRCALVADAAGRAPVPGAINGVLFRAHVAHAAAGRRISPRGWCRTIRTPRCRWRRTASAGSSAEPTLARVSRRG